MNMTQKTNWRTTFLASAALISTAYLFAGEHPSEHPEHPKAGSAKEGSGKASLSKEDLAEAIQVYVEKDAKLKGGFFLVYDKEDKKPLALTLSKVHRDRLSTVSAGVQFVCADFKAEDGTTYDLDIFMKGSDKNHLDTSEVSVHKKNGKERYTWYEEGGVWKKRDAEGSQKEGSGR